MGTPLMGLNCPAGKLTCEVFWMPTRRAYGIDFAIEGARETQLHIAKPIIFEWQEYEFARDIEPTMLLDRETFIQLAKSMAETLEGQGIRTPNANEILGKIAATERHLADMRAIVFKQLKIEEKTSTRTKRQVV